ncbi:MAG: S8 family serine peptidase [candidate division KSB1 bacterium]|nr:S8 family serine peptidase [candidate division KSB1 bacterium]
MKKILFILLVFTVTVFSSTTKLGPNLTRQLLSPEKPTLLSKVSPAAPERAIVTLKHKGNTPNNWPVKVVVRRGRIAVVEGTVSQLVELAGDPLVSYIEKPWPDYAKLNVSTVSVGANLVRSDMDITGKGVLVGIIDSGIDWKHHDFRKPNGMTRIKYVLDLSQPGSVYGAKLITEDDINAALNGQLNIGLTDRGGHGTHVAGIAAGDGSDGQGYGLYCGVAPEADLVIVKATRDDEGRTFQTADQIIALAFIDSIATVLDQPYVTNLSLGGHSGAHDATSPVEQVIDETVGKEVNGKVIVVSSGNEGDQSIHENVAWADWQDDKNTQFNVPEYTPEAGSQNDYVIFSGWYEDKDKIGVKVYTPNGYGIGPVLPGQVYDAESEDGYLYVWNGFYDTGDGSYEPGTNLLNGDREIYIQISDENADTPPAAGEWEIVFTGNAGDVDIWLSYSTMNAEFKDTLDYSMQISVPGTAKDAITVGSFISKRRWEDLDGHSLTWDVNDQYEIGQLAAYSSGGPTRDDRIKPEIVAPGQVIASSMSEFAPADEPQSIFYSGSDDLPNAWVAQDGIHGISGGTSMAAPHVTGAAALILQRYPDATATQVRSIMTRSALVDEHVGAIPDNNWGWGKLDALQAVQGTPKQESIAEEKYLSAFPNPFMNQAQIEFQLTAVEEQKTTINIYNALGQKVRTLYERDLPTGLYSRYWDGTNDANKPVASGVYFVVLKSGSIESVRKLCFLGHTKQ